MDDLTKEDYYALAAFRYAIRRFLRFSENNSRAEGITPQQYQILLMIKGMNDRGWVTVSEIAEFLQVLHHSAVGLCKRAEQIGLVTPTTQEKERQKVCNNSTKGGKKILADIEKKTRFELERFREDIPRLFVGKKQ